MGLAGGGGAITVQGQQWPLARGLSLGVVSTDSWNHGTEALCAETERNECRSWRELRAAGRGVEGVWAQGGAEGGQVSGHPGATGGDPIWVAEAPVQGFLGEGGF